MQTPYVVARILLQQSLFAVFGLLTLSIYNEFIFYCPPTQECKLEPQTRVYTTRTRAEFTRCRIRRRRRRIGQTDWNRVHCESSGLSSPAAAEQNNMSCKSGLCLLLRFYFSSQLLRFLQSFELKPRRFAFLVGTAKLEHQRQIHRIPAKVIC